MARHSGGRSLNDFDLKDSGARQSFSGGMVRDTTEGKTDFLNVFFGPMLTRWAEHLTKGRKKYPDVSPGVPNWTLAQGVEEYLRAKESATRHFFQWLRGDRDEDHAAAVYFNINLAEYVLEQLEIDPALGAAPVFEKGEECADDLASEPAPVITAPPGVIEIKPGPRCRVVQYVEGLGHSRCIQEEGHDGLHVQ